MADVETYFQGNDTAADNTHGTLPHEGIICVRQFVVALAVVLTCGFFSGDGSKPTRPKVGERYRFCSLTQHSSPLTGASRANPRDLTFHNAGKIATFSALFPVSSY